jgi:hypothetical protein
MLQRLNTSLFNHSTVHPDRGFLKRLPSFLFCSLEVTRTPCQLPTLRPLIFRLISIAKERVHQEANDRVGLHHGKQILISHASKAGCFQGIVQQQSTQNSFIPYFLDAGRMCPSLTNSSKQNLEQSVSNYIAIVCYDSEIFNLPLSNGGV